jgi:sulfotransferase family protein
MTLPTFLGIGVPRGGTTWLHTWLASHPDVCMPTNRKEIRFFDRHYERGLDWYEEFFCPSDQAEKYRAIGEISPQYLYCQECPERICATLPDAKLALMLRHPVDRAYSNYGFTVQRSRYRGSFEDFIASRPSALERGFYSRYVKQYLEYFDKTRIFALLFEETFSGSEAPRTRLADFLGIAADKFPSDGFRKKVNPSTVPSSRTLSGFTVKTGRRLRRWGLEPVVDLTRRLGAQRVIARGAPLPAIDAGLRRELSVRYEAEFSELASLLDLDLSSWRE